MRIETKHAPVRALRRLSLWKWKALHCGHEYMFTMRASGAAFAVVLPILPRGIDAGIPAAQIEAARPADLNAKPLAVRRFKNFFAGIG